MSSSDKYGPARFQPGMLASRRWQEQALPKASNTAERLLAASISMREFVGKIEHHVQVSYGQEYRAIAGPLSVNQVRRILQDSSCIPVAQTPQEVAPGPNSRVSPLLICNLIATPLLHIMFGVKSW